MTRKNLTIFIAILITALIALWVSIAQGTSGFDGRTINGVQTLDSSDPNYYQNRLHYHALPVYDSSDYASINAAVTAIGATSATLHVTTSETLTASLTVPATLAVRIDKGGMIVKASTYTLTINGSFSAGRYQVFSGFSSGDITGAGLTTVYPEWWGAAVDDVLTDNGPLIISALSALPGESGVISFNSHTYYVATEILPTFNLNRVMIRGNHTWLQWNGATDATKAIWRATVTTTTYFTNIHWEDVHFNADYKAGFCLVIEGGAVLGGSGSNGYWEACSFDGATVTNVLFGDSDEPYVDDVDSSHHTFAGCTFYNAPHNVTTNAANVYEVLFESCVFGNNGSNPVVQHVRNIKNGTIWINHCDFGQLWKETAGHPHGATDDSYCVYSECGGLAITNCYAEENRILYYVDGGGSYNNHVLVENFYTNDSSDVANRDEAYAVNAQGVSLVLRNVSFEGSGATYHHRKIGVSGGSSVDASNVNLGADKGWWELSGSTLNTITLDGRVLGETDSLIGNWDFSRWVNNDGTHDVPANWVIKTGGEGVFAVSRSTDNVRNISDYTCRILNTTKPTTATVAYVNGISTKIEQKLIGKVTVIVEGYLAAGTAPRIYINELVGQNGTTNFINTSGNNWVLWAEADLTAQVQGNTYVYIGFLTEADGSDFYVRSVVVLPNYLTYGSQSLFTRAKPAKVPSVYYGVAAPTLNGGGWNIGDMVQPFAPAAGGAAGWLCLTASGGGTPGTWMDIVQAASQGFVIKNGATSAGYVDLYEDSDDGTNKVRLAGQTLAADANSFCVYTKQVDLSNANIKALAAGVELVAAPGAGRWLELVSASFWLDYGSEALAEPSSPDDLAIEYDTGTGPAASATIVASGFITAAADTMAFAVPVSVAGTAASALVNKNLALINTGGDYTGNASNDTVLRVIVNYRIHDSLGL